MRVDGATGLGTRFAGAPPIPHARTDRAERHQGAGNERERGGLVELALPGGVVADERDQIKSGSDHVCTDRNIGKRRVQRLSRPTPQAFERPPAERKGGTKGEMPHVLPPYLETARGETYLNPPATR